MKITFVASTLVTSICIGLYVAFNLPLSLLLVNLMGFLYPGLVTARILATEPGGPSKLDKEQFLFYWLIYSSLHLMDQLLFDQNLITPSYPLIKATLLFLCVPLALMHEEKSRSHRSLVLFAARKFLWAQLEAAYSTRGKNDSSTQTCEESYSTLASSTAAAEREERDASQLGPLNSSVPSTKRRGRRCSCNLAWMAAREDSEGSDYDTNNSEQLTFGTNRGSSCRVALRGDANDLDFVCTRL